MFRALQLIRLVSQIVSLVVCLVVIDRAYAETCIDAGDLKEVTPIIRPQDTEKWLKAHEVIRKRIRKNKNADLIFIGDSVLAHWPLDGIGSRIDSRRLLNLAIGGDQTQNVLWRLNSLPLEFVHPKKVVILIGTNNLRRNSQSCGITAGILSVSKKIKRVWPEADSIIIGILPRGDDLLYKDNERRRINENLRKYASHGLFKYVDPDEAFLCKGSNECGYYQDDLVHLTQIGYDIFLSILQPELKDFLCPERC